MNNNFIIIAVTAPHFFQGEAEKINEIIDNGKAWYVHIRKPDSTSFEMEKLIRDIKPEYYKRLKLHDHFELVDKYSLGGYHLNSRNRVVTDASMSLSKSIHSLEEMDDLNKYEYIFLSPVFDSISKHNYKAAFDLEKLEERIKGKNVVALGGVTPDKFEVLKSIGFIGAAMLGYFFKQYF